MGAPFGIPRLRLSRPSYSLRYRIIVAIFILVLVQQQRLFFIYRDALAAKYSPTIFDAKFGRVESRLPSVDKNSNLRTELLENRGSWQELGSGWEGSTFTYNDVVIKTFTPRRSPFRNCALCEPHSKWPTEIPASLYFGNLMASGITNTSSGETTSAFLPVMAHFLAATEPGSAPEWHLVTPFLPEGNLRKLSKKIHGTQNARSSRALDAEYRPAFNRLLRTLDGMHRSGFCHDDIKPDNIFIRDEAHWVLGDLGNVRHVSNRYHSSRIWSNNKQLPDCRANDALRALKSYMKFLRSASNDRSSFDAEFFERRVPFSKLFWSTISDPLTMTAEDLHARSSANEFFPTLTPDGLGTSSSPAPQSGFALVSCLRKYRLEKEVQGVLRISLSEGLSRVFGLTWIFGVPAIPC
jgi:hypothetical protein